MAAVVPGRIVVLDEPTNDVDPLRRKLLWQQVRALADNGAAVLLVTHNVLEAERCVDRLAIVDHGRVVAQGTPAALKGELGGALRLELVLEPGAEPPATSPFGPATTVGRRLFIDVGSTTRSARWRGRKRPARCRHRRRVLPRSGVAGRRVRASRAATPRLQSLC